MCVDLHEFDTSRDIDMLRMQLHGTALYEQLPSQVSEKINNHIPGQFKELETPKTSNLNLATLVVIRAFYSVGEYVISLVKCGAGGGYTNKITTNNNILFRRALQMIHVGTTSI